MPVAAQVSLYPLGEEDIGPPIERAVAILRQHGLRVEVGPMSSVIVGDDELLFAALAEVYRTLAGEGLAVVIVATLSNACPVDPGSGRPAEVGGGKAAH